jgi:hypothetical protein
MSRSAPCAKPVLIKCPPPVRKCDGDSLIKKCEAPKERCEPKVKCDSVKVVKLCPPPKCKETDGLSRETCKTEWCKPDPCKVECKPEIVKVCQTDDVA